jgi:uncharacterized repeat protein (TIGR01451 family)
MRQTARTRMLGAMGNPGDAVSAALPRAMGVTVLATAGVLVLSGVAAAQPAPGFTELVSVSSAGVQGDQDSQRPSVSADGRFVAFASLSDNLVPADTNLSSDIFVRDRRTGTTQRVSVSTAGRQSNRDSGLLNGMGGPSISADGRYVAFDSEATNLVRGDTNGAADVFVHDRLTGTTERVSVASGGAQANAGGTEPDISGDGRFVAFVSFSDNLVPDANFTGDIFVRDRQTGVTERISEAPDGTDANSQSLLTPRLNDDGRFVYFTSFASNLVPADTDNSDVDAYLFDRLTQTMTAITSNRGSSGSFVINHGTAGGISGDGRFLTFTTGDNTFITPDTNNFFEDAWLVDRGTGEYTLVGVNDAGQQGDDSTFAGDVSDGGRFVALVSRSTNFGGPANFRENVYVRDRAAGTTRIVSVASDGTEGDLDSLQPAMTPDGMVIAFASRSSTFVPETQDFFAYDIFARDMRPQADLSVAMSDSPDPVRVRDQLTYTVTVWNDGPAAGTGVTLVDTLPDAAFVSATPTQGACVHQRLSSSGGVLTCELGALAAGSSATVTIVVSPSREGTITNTASVRANEPDADGADNSATETTTVLPR